MTGAARERGSAALETAIIATALLLFLSAATLMCIIYLLSTSGPCTSGTDR